MQEIIEVLEKHWVIFSALGAGILYLTKHLINAHQIQTVSSNNLAGLMVKYEAKEKEDNSKVAELNDRIDDYHIKAVAREQTIKQDAVHLIDKAKLEIGKELSILERELRQDIRSIGNKVEEGNKLLIQILNDNKHTQDTVVMLLKHKEEQALRTEAFWKEYGALLPALKDLVLRSARPL